MPGSSEPSHNPVDVLLQAEHSSVYYYTEIVVLIFSLFESVIAFFSNFLPSMETRGWVGVTLCKKIVDLRYKTSLIVFPVYSYDIELQKQKQFYTLFDSFFLSF